MSLRVSILNHSAARLGPPRSAPQVNRDAAGSQLLELVRILDPVPRYDSPEICPVLISVLYIQHIFIRLYLRQTRMLLGVSFWNLQEYWILRRGMLVLS